MRAHAGAAGSTALMISSRSVKTPGIRLSVTLRKNRLSSHDVILTDQRAQGINGTQGIITSRVSGIIAITTFVVIPEEYRPHSSGNPHISGPTQQWNTALYTLGDDAAKVGG